LKFILITTSSLAKSQKFSSALFPLLQPSQTILNSLRISCSKSLYQLVSIVNMASRDIKKIENSVFAPTIKRIFSSFGVDINGDKPSDMKFNTNKMWYRMVKYHIGIDRLAVGEGYMDGLWDCDDLQTFFEKVFLESHYAFNKHSMRVSKLVHSLPLLAFNLQSKSRCKKDISSHYDIGNDLFKLMLDRSMNYSCGYWTKNAFLNPTIGENELQVKTNTLCETLDEAQLNKMLLIARKLNLSPGMTILDIGCGWGYLAKFLAINFDVHVLGITISKEQIKYATTTDLEQHELDFLRIPGLKSEGTGTFKFELRDYRDTKETFDRIVSVGMLEHVGKKNYDEYFKICHRNLKDDGLALIHTIGVCHDFVPQVEPWCNKYIFPGGMTPYQHQIVKATFGRFVIEDWHNMGYNYYRTLNVWHKNFLKSWPQLEGKYDQRFKRMWEFFLCSSAALFKTRRLNLWQIVLSKDGFQGGYVSLR